MVSSSSSSDDVADNPTTLALNENFRAHGPLDHLRVFLMRMLDDPTVVGGNRLLAVLVLNKVCTTLMEECYAIDNCDDGEERLMRTLKPHCDNPSLDFKRFVMTAVCHYSDTDDSNDRVWVDLLKDVMKKIDPEMFAEYESCKPKRYKNLEKFFDGLYRCSKDMFTPNTFDSMIREFTNYFVNELLKAPPKCKCHVDFLFSGIINFVIYRGDIDIGASSIANGLDDFESPIDELLEACRLDGIELDYGKLDVWSEEDE